MAKITPETKIKEKSHETNEQQTSEKEMELARMLMAKTSRELKHLWKRRNLPSRCLQSSSAILKRTFIMRSETIRMNRKLEYKGYVRSVEFSEQDRIFYGKVKGIHALISYEGTTIKELSDDFREAIESYLEFCEAEGIEPEKPSSLV